MTLECRHERVYEWNCYCTFGCATCRIAFKCADCDASLPYSFKPKQILGDNFEYDKNRAARAEVRG